MSGVQSARTRRLGVLADDLTGAHATAAQLARGGKRALVIWDPDALSAGTDAVVVDMRTRDDKGAVPRQRSETWAKLLVAAGCDTFELRVDTTLRGATAEELVGLLVGTGLKDPLVVAVPAYPSAGRTTVDGWQLIRHGRGPVRRLHVGPQIFGDAAWASVDTSVMHAGSGAVVAHINAHKRQGCRRFVLDAQDARHLAVAANAVQLLRACGQEIVTVSSGAWLAHQQGTQDDSFALLVVASPTDANRAQLEYLLQCRSLPVWEPAQVVADPPATLQATAAAVVVQTFSLAGRDATAAQDAAQAARQLLVTAQAAGRRCRGLIVTGGNAAAQVVTALGAHHLEPRDDVRPLCPMGVLRGGPWSGLPLITKGGVIGDSDTLVALLAAINTVPNTGAFPPS